MVWKGQVSVPFLYPDWISFLNAKLLYMKTYPTSPPGCLITSQTQDAQIRLPEFLYPSPKLTLPSDFPTYYGLNVFTPNSYVQVLTGNGIVTEGGAFERRLCLNKVMGVWPSYWD